MGINHTGLTENNRKIVEGWTVCQKENSGAYDNKYAGDVRYKIPYETSHWQGRVYDANVKNYINFFSQIFCRWFEGAVDLVYMNAVLLVSGWGGKEELL